MIGRGRIDVCRGDASSPRWSSLLHEPAELAVGSSWYRATRYQQNLRGVSPIALVIAALTALARSRDLCPSLQQQSGRLDILKWRKGDATARCDAGHALHRCSMSSGWYF